MRPPSGRSFAPLEGEPFVPEESELKVPEYRLRLDVDPEGLRWEGTVELDPVGGGRPLVLDAEGLAVSSVRVGARPATFAYDTGSHRLAIDRAPHDGGSVAVDFSGAVEAKSLYGMYRSRHGDGQLITTHCEPAGARRIFPCLDRPDRKSRIRLTVRAPSDLEVISNAPVRATRPESGRTEWTFEPTPEMSTYLFYLGVGRFDSRREQAGTLAVRVAAPPGRGDAGAWALRSAGRIVRAYEAYYGIPYPLPKLDLIAVAEHAFGAMENWGAISYQETRLLVDGASSSFSTHDVFTTTAHEIAHQWFGNLVTMRWWDDIWLNESFAALMETKITDALEPTFEPWDDFLLRTQGKAWALDGDSLRATHPVRAHVDRPEELSQIFDEISYGKGSSILAMFDRYLGEERFRAGVTDYLKTFRYGNARTEDLLAALGRASGEPVGELAAPWIDRPGLPLITADAARNGVVLTQRRFGYLGTTEEPPWPIPLTLDVGTERRRLLFRERQARLEVADGAPVLLNPGSIGFYRCRYDPELLGRLLAVLPRRPALDGWAVLDDLAAFVLSGDADWATYARAVEAFSGRSDRLLAESLAGSLAGFALQVPDAAAVGRTARAYLRRGIEQVGLEPRPGEPAGAGIARDRLAFARVRVDAEFAAELSPRFDTWARLDPDLRTSVAIARVRAGGARGVEAVRVALRRPGSDIEALRLERALAWSGDPGEVRRILDLASAGGINRSHVFGIALQAAGNPAGHQVGWQWLQERLETLTDVFRGSGYLPLLLEHTLPLFGRGRLAEVRRFFGDHPTPEGTRGLAKGLERLEILERLRGRLS